MKTSSDPPTNNNRAGKLDELLALLAEAPPSAESGMAQEHIRSARSHVWGAMHAECELDLTLAGTAIGHIADGATRCQLRRR
jgi:hypothetical protein